MATLPSGPASLLTLGSDPVEAPRLGRRLAGTLRLCMALGLLAAGLLGPAQAEDGHGMVVVPGEVAVRWSPAPPSLPRGSEISILYGDPDKPGPFTLRVRFPADTLVAPHTHAADESVTLLSGSLMHAMGETVDKARGKAMTQGGFVFLPARMPHSLWTAAEPATVQVSGVGPFGLIYVNPADDPSRQDPARR